MFTTLTQPPTQPTRNSSNLQLQWFKYAHTHSQILVLLHTTKNQQNLEHPLIYVIFVQRLLSQYKIGQNCTGKTNARVAIFPIGHFLGLATGWVIPGEKLMMVNVRLSEALNPLGGP